MARLTLIPLLLCWTAGMLPAQEAKNPAGQEAPPDAKAEAKEAPKADKAQPAADSLAEQVKKNPNDTATLIKYVNQELGGVMGGLGENADAAGKRLKELEQTLDALEPDQADAKALLAQAKRVVDSVGERVTLARLSLDDVKKKLEANPDADAFKQFTGKVSLELSMLARSKPEEAEKKLQAAKDFLTKIQEQSEDKEVDRLAASAARSFAAVEQTIASGLKLTKLVGKDAAPLAVEAWVNGSPLTDADLKGKVVLLDFWAVWCGPCIATFPHLREWQEKYSEQGLVIVGLTRYYNYEWDEDAGRASRGKEVSPEKEQQMLEKFAEHHKLEHRFAIQKGNDLSEYYGVQGIPHVVVVDRQGKVRIVRVGSGEQNARDVEEAIKKAIGSET